MKKGGPLVNLFIFLSTFMFKISTAIDLEFHVANSFSNEEAILKVKPEGRTTRDAVKLAHGEEFQYSLPVTKYRPWMKLECEVYICVGNDEFLLDSFVLFELRWSEKTFRDFKGDDKFKYNWTLNEEGAFLLSSSSSLSSSHTENQEMMHKWREVLLIFTMTNRFLGQEDIILSIYAMQSKAIIADSIVRQEKIRSGEKHISHYSTLGRIHTSHINLNFKCFYDRVLKGVRRYVGSFEINYSRQQSGRGETIAVRYFEYILGDEGATMIAHPHN